VGGGFTPKLFAELKDRPEAVRELARELLSGRSASTSMDHFAARAETRRSGRK
jgi:hypothetical protein